MGTLRSYDIEIDPETGAKTYLAQGLVVNGVLLGEPIEIDGDPGSAEWDDSAFPNGTIDGAGIVTPDEEEVI
jgi:hypothetical protein